MRDGLSDGCAVVNKNAHNAMTGHEIKNTDVFSILKKKELREKRSNISFKLKMKKYGYSYP